MRIKGIKNVILQISKDDLIKFDLLKKDDLALIRLNNSELSKIISTIMQLNYNDLEIVDYSYYGVINDEINYDIKFYMSL